MIPNYTPNLNIARYKLTNKIWTAYCYPFYYSQLVHRVYPGFACCITTQTKAPDRKLCLTVF